jgi:hypothetical protein
LIAWAEELGHDNLISLLNANLKEEKAADKKLNMLAEGGVNRRAKPRGAELRHQAQARSERQVPLNGAARPAEARAPRPKSKRKASHS